MKSVNQKTIRWTAAFVALVWLAGAASAFAQLLQVQQRVYGMD